MWRSLPKVLVGAGSVLVLASLGILYVLRQTDRPTPIALPIQIAGVSKSRESSGSEAAAEFVSLHGKRFPLTAGSVAIYGDGRLILWVAGTPFSFMSAALLEAMDNRIAERNSPFTPLGQWQDGRRMVRELEGMGQQHFYFQSGKFIVWLASDPSIADPAIRQILEAFP